MTAQRRMFANLRGGGADQGAAVSPHKRLLPLPNLAATVQRAPIVHAQVNGVTHLRQSRLGDESLVRGRDYEEVEHPMIVTIDKGDIWDSHLGMNLSVSDEPDQVWYRVVSFKGKLLNHVLVYIRGEMCSELPPIQVEAETKNLVGKARKRAATVKEKGAPPKKPDLNKVPLEKRTLVLEAYGKQLAKYEKDPADPRQLLLQSLGDPWEQYLRPLIAGRYAGCSIYWGVRSDKAELDFIVIHPGGAVTIVSAKLRAAAFEPDIDMKWWRVISAEWENLDKADCLIAGPPVDHLREGVPEIYCESLESNGLTLEAFLANVER